MGNSRRALTRVLYKKVIKPVLFLVHPDTVHRHMLKLAVVLGHLPLTTALGRVWFGVHVSPRARVLAGLNFRNPVGIAAGLDKNGELLQVADMIGCGFTTVGSLTLEPRRGNPKPWFYRLPKSRSIVVHAGMANRGLRAVTSRLSRRPKGLVTLVSVAIVAQRPNADDSAIIADALEAVEYIVRYNLADAIELNVSCPNAGDNEPFTETERLERLLSECDARSISLPVFLKLPNRERWDQFEPIVDVALKHDVQGVTIANLVKDRLNVNLHDPLPEDVKGGLSGEPTRVRSTELIRRTREKAGDKLVIIGVGGVMSVRDAQEKLDAGADLVGLVSGLIFEGPQLAGDIVEAIETDRTRKDLQN